jgi:hypothetical protein
VFNRLVDMVLFACWMMILTAAPFAIAAAGLALLDRPASGPITLSTMFVAVTFIALPSAFVMGALGWLARTSPALSRRYALDNPHRLAFVGVGGAYALPAIVALPMALEVALFVVVLSVALWLLTGVGMTPSGASGCTYKRSGRSFDAG